MEENLAWKERYHCRSLDEIGNAIMENGEVGEKGTDRKVPCRTGTAGWHGHGIR